MLLKRNFFLFLSVFFALSSCEFEDSITASSESNDIYLSRQLAELVGFEHTVKPTFVLRINQSKQRTPIGYTDGQIDIRGGHINEQSPQKISSSGEIDFAGLSSTVNNSIFHFFVNEGEEAYSMLFNNSLNTVIHYGNRGNDLYTPFSVLCKGIDEILIENPGVAKVGHHEDFLLRWNSNTQESTTNKVLITVSWSGGVKKFFTEDSGEFNIPKETLEEIPSESRFRVLIQRGRFSNEHVGDKNRVIVTITNCNARFIKEDISISGE